MKATIIAKATAYILARERDSKRLRRDIVPYRSRIAAFVVGRVAAVGGGECVTCFYSIHFFFSPSFPGCLGAVMFEIGDSVCSCGDAL
jgi:hypothetical protein